MNAGTHQRDTWVAWVIELTRIAAVGWKCTAVRWSTGRVTHATPELGPLHDGALGEAGLAAVLDRVSDGVVTVDPNFVFTSVNAAAGELARRMPETLMGRHMFDAFPEARGSVFEERFREAFDTQQVLEFEQGSAILGVHLSLKVFPFSDGLAIVCRDVTEVVNTQQGLDESEERYRLLAENSSDVVYLAGPDRRVTWISANVSRAIGWTAHELVGTSMFDLIHPEDQARIAAVQEQVFAGIQVENPSGGYVSRFRAKDGSWVWMSLTSATVNDSEGRMRAAVISMRDVTSLVEARQRAEAEGEHVAAILASMLDPHVLLQAVRGDQGRIVDFEYQRCNDAACEYMGMSRNKLEGARLLDLLPWQAGSGMLALYVDVVETGEPLVLDDYSYAHEIVGGEQRYDIRGVKVGDALSFTWRDVTERHEYVRTLADSEERYRLLAENSSDVVLRTHGEDVAWVSSSLTRELGWAPEKWIGSSLAAFRHPDDLQEFARALEQLEGGQREVLRIRLADPRGTWHWVEMHMRAYSDAQGNPDGQLSSFRVVDREVEAERMLERRAHFDDLTGALKREPALKRLHDIGQHQRKPGNEVGVLFIDIDDFKQVNDSLGHAAGDTLLCAYADRIRDHIRAADTIARIGGDEYLVILTGLHALGEAVAVAEKIRRACEQPVVTREGAAVTTVSVGVTLSSPIETGDDMIDRADRAMYRAKKSGRNQVIVAPPPRLAD